MQDSTNFVFWTMEFPVMETLTVTHTANMLAGLRAPKLKHATIRYGRNGTGEAFQHFVDNFQREDYENRVEWHIEAQSDSFMGFLR